jgi:hypothetical protein
VNCPTCGSKMRALLTSIECPSCDSRDVEVEEISIRLGPPPGDPPPRQPGELCTHDVLYRSMIAVDLDGRPEVYCWSCGARV